MKPQSLQPNEMLDCGRTFHAAAKTLAREFPVGFPVLHLYRQAVELHLKAIVLGPGARLLKSEPDAISVSQSHSVSWLAQIVSRIVKAAGREDAGVAVLADFKRLMETINSVDPGEYTYRCPIDPQSPEQVRDFTVRLDAILDVLSSTADGLAAGWNLRILKRADGSGRIQ